MSHRSVNINQKDNSFSAFARALALPVRIQIVRLIIENGFTISREDLYGEDFARETITKRLAELRSLGVLKMDGSKGHITYNIDESWFTQMMTEFLNFFGKCISMPKP
ncbi:hypothetical protein ACFGVS_20655 [Mucilaginibacter sp. AW1-7]|uniref:hypothetical protein n=1 Tax=Mucilaginibacter sp. AW1-7 TaxID=3349874 RepID=UPI003F73BC97